MKKLLYSKSMAFAILMALAGTMQSCTEKEEEDVYASTKIDFNVTVSPSRVDLPARNASQEIQVTANTAWGVSSDVTWAHVSTSSGIANGSFTVTLDDNTSLEERQAIITLTYGTEKKTVTLNQAAAKATLSANEVSLAAKNASQEIKVTANTTWSVETEAEWIHLSATGGTENGTFTLTLDDNKSLQPRQATIVVNYGKEGKEIITVNQVAADATTFGKVQVSGITRYEATVASSFSAMFEVQEYGVVYSYVNKEPVISEDDRNTLSVKVGTAPTSQGSISTKLSNLKSATTYYLRFYTRGPLGIEYSPVTTFKTEGQTPSEGDHETPEI